MTITLKITDGTTTVDLLAYVPGVTDYVPRSPKFVGDEPDNVSETCEVYINGATTDLAITACRNIESLFTQARNYQLLEQGPRVYVQFRPTATGNIFQSELLSGQIDVHAETIQWRLVTTILRVVLAWTRRGYWEDTSETELTSGATTINNHDDGAHNNYVDIDELLIGGVLPASCRIEMTNPNATILGTIYAGLNTFKGTAMPDHTLEGEDSTGLVDAAAVGTASNDAYGTHTIVGTSTQLAARWNLTASVLNKFAGQFVHAVMRAPLSSAGIYAQLKMVNSGGTSVYAEGPEVLMNANDELQDLGAIQVPPYLTGETNFYAADLLLYVRGPNTAIIYCDYVALMPTNGWRKYTSTVGLTVNSTLNDDSSTGRTYVNNISGAGAQRSARFIAQGKPILVYPGRDNRFVFLNQTTTGGSSIGQALNIRVYYRPRRLTL